MRRIVEYAEAKGKTVEKVTLCNTDEFRGVEIAFTDQTALHFEFCVYIEVDPSLMNWKSGDGKQIKKFPSVREVA